MRERNIKGMTHARTCAWLVLGLRSRPHVNPVGFRALAPPSWMSTECSGNLSKAHGLNKLWSSVCFFYWHKTVPERQTGNEYPGDSRCKQSMRTLFNGQRETRGFWIGKYGTRYEDDLGKNTRCQGTQNDVVGGAWKLLLPKTDNKRQQKPEKHSRKNHIVSERETNTQTGTQTHSVPCSVDVPVASFGANGSSSLSLILYLAQCLFK